VFSVYYNHITSIGSRIASFIWYADASTAFYGALSCLTIHGEVVNNRITYLSRTK